MLFFATCEQNEELTTIEQPTSQIVAVNQDQHLTSLINSIKNSSSSARATSFLDNVNLDTAWKEVDEQYHLTNYSFTTNNNATYSKRTFVLTEYDGESFGYIFELEADSIWLSEFSEFPGWKGFTGSFRILNLEEEILAETPMKDGRADSELISSNENGRNVTYEYFCPESYVTIGAYFNEITQHWEPEPIVHANPCYWIVIKDDRDWELGDIDPEDPYGENQGNGGSGGITFPTNEYECNPGSTRNANGHCVRNHLLCGENSVYDLITETCECKPGFEIDENGICLEEQNPFALCANTLTFVLTGDGFTANIASLGASILHDWSGKVINAEFGLSCVQLNPYQIATVNDAALAFAEVYNTARDQLAIWARKPAQNRLITSSELKLKLKELILEEINFYGGSFSIDTGCNGNIPVSTAGYDTDC